MTAYFIYSTTKKAYFTGFAYSNGGGPYFGRHGTTKNALLARGWASEENAEKWIKFQRKNRHPIGGHEIHEITVS